MNPRIKQAQPKRFPFSALPCPNLFLFFVVKCPQNNPHTLFVQIHRFQSSSYKYQPMFVSMPVHRQGSCPYYPAVVACRDREPLRLALAYYSRQQCVRVHAVNPLRSSPAPLSRKALVEQREDFCHIELDVLQVQIFLTLLLHFEQVVEFQIQLQKAPVTALVV